MNVTGNAMVASSQVTAVDAGLAILNNGGNAIDAAIATAACLTVVEPCNNGIGGDCFALIWDGTALHGLNASGRSPAGWTPDRFSTLDRMPESGWESVTVPGQVAGWAALSERFGNIGLSECLHPAIQAAEDGFVVTPNVACGWAAGMERFKANKHFLEMFGIGGTGPTVGCVCRLPGHASTLRRISESDGQDFYHGELAKAICAAAAEGGSCLNFSDLAQCHADWVTPLSIDACGVTGYEIPPNGQGVAALAACGVAEHLGLDDYELDHPQAVHLQIEAMKQAFADLVAEVSDPEYMRLAPQALLNANRLAARAALVDPHRAGPNNPIIPPSSGTVLLTTADADGKMVSFIQSNFHGFGSGEVVPGTGIALQNRGCGFVLTPGHPNQVGPNKRPFHTIIPGFWFRDGQPLGPFGCMGGHMQAQGHLQIWQRIFRWGQAPQDALDAKRWRLQADGCLLVEDGFCESTVRDLAHRGHRIERKPSNFFGGAQLILRQADGTYTGASDPRKDGKVGAI